MKIKLSNAVKFLYGESSFEWVFYEAVANAIDAEATNINIKIVCNGESDKKNLEVEINDNGIGFDDDRFKKFSQLLDVEEDTHKGVGRLVYLSYFDRINIVSIFGHNHQRTFEYSDSFDGESKIEEIENSENGTTLKMSEYKLSKLYKNDFIAASYIRQKLLEHFYIRLYKAKQKRTNICISISSTIGGKSQEKKIETEKMPNLSVEPIIYQQDFFDKIDMYYLIKKTTIKEEYIITALAIDNRTKSLDIISDENLPHGYQMIFLLISESFNGKTDNNRNNLTFSDAEINNIKAVFRKNIAKVINEKFPEIAKLNKERKYSYANTYPHLSGYFDDESIGFSSQQDIIKKAQDKFFKEQKEILGAENLTPEQFEKSLELSSRVLVEYILFRQKVIERLKKEEIKDKESEIHNLIVPKRTEHEKSKLSADIYRNNVWVLDDKFMTYNTILSEYEMSRVIDVITEGEDKIKDDGRPDIALVFSGNPSDIKEKFYVVIVELKRMGLKAGFNSIVEEQLESRARRLSKYYNDRIQRVWYYGIVDMDDDYILHLRSNEFKPLFSRGKIFFKSKNIALNVNGNEYIIADTYIMDFKALVADADARNSTFLQLMRSQFTKDGDSK